jgi:hypothetical protein
MNHLSDHGGSQRTSAAKVLCPSCGKTKSLRQYYAHMRGSYPSKCTGLLSENPLLNLTKQKYPQGHPIPLGVCRRPCGTEGCDKAFLTSSALNAHRKSYHKKSPPGTGNMAAGEKETVEETVEESVVDVKGLLASLASFQANEKSGNGKAKANKEEESFEANEEEEESFKANEEEESVEANEEESVGTETDVFPARQTCLSGQTLSVLDGWKKEFGGNASVERADDINHATMEAWMASINPDDCDFWTPDRHEI